MSRVLRPNKNGGVSICCSPDNFVGKGRCCHVLSDADTVTMKYDKQNKIYMVDVSNTNLNLSLKIEEQKVKEFFNNLENSLSKEEREELISSIQGV